MDGSNIAIPNESHTNATITFDATDIERSPTTEELSTSDVSLECTQLTTTPNTDNDNQCIVAYRCGENLRPMMLQLSWEADSIWTLRLHTLMLECARLQLQMAWLSTLGGAYSSLGEHFPAHAHQAGIISLKQVALANEMGNPLLAVKCRLFIAWSLLQKGKLDQAATIIRSQYQYVCKDASDDTKLKAMCQAAWTKLKQCRKMKKPSDNENY